MNGLDTESRTAWISQGFECLAERVRLDKTATHFDILIIGSGYGGAVAAATFAGREKGGMPLKIGVLERGNEYLPGSFPTGLGELPRHVRHGKEKEGLFDVRLGTGVSTVVANGVGGGSLINAGVMEAPLPEVFASGWPAALANATALDSFFERARVMLGAGSGAARNTIEKHPDGLPEKFRSIRNIAKPGTFKAAALSVAMSDGESSGKVRLNKCIRCGDCATGCNFGAKNSLDVSVLVSAQQLKAEIFSGATVLRLSRDAGAWIVECVHTNAKLRERAREITNIRADKVVLAAGTLGSTEILMRSQPALQFSSQLGKRCSTNGDMLVADYATEKPVNTVANETVKPSHRAIGPTITGIIDLRKKHGMLIEEM
jgi:cholesterol oxidase